MVLLDDHQPTTKFLFWKRAALSIILFILIYFGGIKPLQSILIDKIIYPPLIGYIQNYPNFYLIIIEDEMRLISYSTFPQVPVKIEWPLNGSICLAFTLLFIGGNRKMMRKIILYQFVFITLIPLAVLLIINGHGLMEMIYGIHLKLYKLLFLFIGFLSIMDLYSKIPKENKSH
jgi:hypothetical protein